MKTPQEIEQERNRLRDERAAKVCDYIRRVIEKHADDLNMVLRIDPPISEGDAMVYSDWGVADIRRRVRRNLIAAGWDASWEYNTVVVKKAASPERGLFTTIVNKIKGFLE